MICHPTFRFSLLAAILLIGPVAPSARAALMVTVLNSAASAGGTGSFDVVLMSTGGTFAVSGFSVELQVAPTSGVRFTAASTSTASPYLFTSQQNSPFTFGTFPTTDFIASDADLTEPYTVTVAPGSTFGLEHVTYTVAGWASPGPIAVAILGTTGTNRTTEVDDINSNPLAITPTDGTIMINASVPEPTSALLVALGLIGTSGLAAVRSAHRPS